MNIGLVCTTIGDGSFLKGYCKEAEEKGLKDDVAFYIIRDKKEKVELHDNLRDVIGKGFTVMCFNVSAQDDFLRKLGFNLVPYNSDNRRNIGYLQALVHNEDVIISIDDDNYFVEGSNFFEEHSVAGQYGKQETVDSVNDWYNICRHLDLKEYYPRGFPYRKRGINSFLSPETGGIVAVNEGLW